MNPISLPCFFAVGLLLTGATVSADSLVRQDEQALAEKSARIAQGQAENAEIRVKSHSVPSARNPLRRSSVLSFNGKCAIIPAGAVLNLPDRFADRVVSKPVGDLVSFPDFLRINFNWLTTKELSKGALEGTQAAQPASKPNDTYVIIATRNRSPISAKISTK